MSNPCSDQLCPQNEKCVSPNKYDCQCNEGFFRNASGSCVDIDECSTAHSCDRNAECLNFEGFHKCTCKIGFFGDGQLCFEGQCHDAVCPINKKCVSSTSTDCTCKSGLESNSTGECTDIDECSKENVCHINAECSNTFGTYECSCKKGFVGNGRNCECPAGFILTNETACIDIDECEERSICHVDAKCSNSIGSYKCECRTNFWGGGKMCSDDSIFVDSGYNRKD